MASVQASKVCFISLWNFHSNISHFGKYSAKYTQHAGNIPCRLSYWPQHSWFGCTVAFVCNTKSSKIFWTDYAPVLGKSQKWVQLCPIMFQKGTVGGLEDNWVCRNTQSIQSSLHLSLLHNFLYDYLHSDLYHTVTKYHQATICSTDFTMYTDLPVNFFEWHLQNFMLELRTGSIKIRLT